MVIISLIFLTFFSIAFSVIWKWYAEQAENGVIVYEVSPLWTLGSTFAGIFLCVIYLITSVFGTAL